MKISIYGYFNILSTRAGRNIDTESDIDDFQYSMFLKTSVSYHH